jgi:inner membrane protein YidH
MTESENLSANALAQRRTDLAISRNLMAADRTLMAWVRTALSLDSFGFTIYKVLVTFQQGGGQLPQGHTPRNIGLFLTGLGTIAMLMGTVEYWQTLKGLHEFRDFRVMRPSLVIALVMSVMGVFLFVSIMTKLF